MQRMTSFFPRYGLFLHGIYLFNMEDQHRHHEEGSHAFLPGTPCQYRKTLATVPQDDRALLILEGKDCVFFLQA